MIETIECPECKGTLVGYSHFPFAKATDFECKECKKSFQKSRYNNNKGYILIDRTGK